MGSMGMGNKHCSKSAAGGTILDLVTKTLVIRGIDRDILLLAKARAIKVVCRISRRN